MVRTRTRLDRDTVVEAARDLLDEDGIASFSMARLGDRLGVTSMALYRHVRDRAELEQAVVELVLADLVLDDEPDGAIAAWMRGVRAHWLAHPWLGSLLGTATSLNPSWIVVLEQLVSALERAGLDDEGVARELVRISRVTCGIALQEVASPLPQRGSMGDVTKRYGPELRRYSGDALFDDLVAEAIARVNERAKAR